MMRTPSLGKSDKKRGIALRLLVAASLLLTISSNAQAAAPARSGQPYAESICNTDPNVILCEDFNYPSDFNCTPAVGGTFNDQWLNPGLAIQTSTFQYGCNGRQINPVGNYPTQPVGSPTGGYVWTANWDSSKGAQNNGGTLGVLRNPGGTFKNGSAPTRDWYIRFQYYVTANYTWPGDPKTDKYNYGAYPCFDNKILYMWPTDPGYTNPTSASYDAGFFTACGMYDSTNNARFSDALAVRYGDAGDNYKYFPMDVGAISDPQHMEYAPYYSMTLRNPSDPKRFGKIFRFNTNQWYTLELHYQLGTSAGAQNGTVEVWVDGTKVYSASDLATCGSGGGACDGLGAIWLGAYHNGADVTTWNGQQVIDNLVISSSYIGPPSSTPTAPPTAPGNLTVAP